MNAGLGFSSAKDTGLAAQEALSSAKIGLAGTADLAVVFSSSDMASNSLLKTISGLLPDVPIIGSSSTIIIADSGLSKHGVIILLLSFSEGTYFNTAVTRGLTLRANLAGEELGDKLLYGFKDVRRSLGLVFSDALTEVSSDFIFGLQERLGKSFPLTGSSASEDTPLKSQLFFGDSITNDACVGILWGGKFNFGLGIKHGWKPLGKPHTVTKASGNIVDEIDARPAVKFYQDYLGCDLARLKKVLKQVSIFYPIGLNLSGEAEYLLRNILSIENNGAIRFQGDVPESSTIRLMIGTRETCLEATRIAAVEAKNSMPEIHGREPDGKKTKIALVFSSISRYMLLKRDAARELKIIKEVLGPDIPILGLYTHGELAPLRAINYRGQVYFHNQAVTVLIIGD